MIDKVTENRLRRAAKRQGLKLLKSRARKPTGLTYGLYKLRRGRTGGLALNVVLPTPQGWFTAQEVSDLLKEPL